MNMKGIVVVACALGGMGALLHVLDAQDGEPVARGTPKVAVQNHTLPAGAAVAPAVPGNPVYWSPFSASSATATVKTMDERIAARRELMKTMGINTPEEYFRMSLGELRKRAASKDVMALLQLAAQFEGENDALEADPDYDFSTSPADQQTKYLTEAVSAGHLHSASILARRHLASGAPVDGLAWQLYAEKLGYAREQAWASKAFSHLSPDQRQRAEMKASTLYQQAYQRAAAGG